MSHEIFCFLKIKISPALYRGIGASYVCFLSLHYLSSLFFNILFDKIYDFICVTVVQEQKSIKIKSSASPHICLRLIFVIIIILICGDNELRRAVIIVVLFNPLSKIENQKLKAWKRNCNL